MSALLHHTNRMSPSPLPARLGHLIVVSLFAVLVQFPGAAQGDYRWSATDRAVWDTASNWSVKGSAPRQAPGRGDTVLDPLVEAPGAVAVRTNTVIKDWEFTGAVRRWDVYKSTSGNAGLVSLAVEGTLSVGGGLLRIRNASGTEHQLALLANAIDVHGGTLHLGLERDPAPVGIQRLQAGTVVLRGGSRFLLQVVEPEGGQIAHLLVRGPGLSALEVRHESDLNIGQFLTVESGRLRGTGNLNVADAVLRFVLAGSGTAPALERRSGAWKFAPAQRYEVADRGEAVPGTRYELIRGLDADPGVAQWVNLNPVIRGQLEYANGRVYFQFERP